MQAVEARLSRPIIRLGADLDLPAELKRRMQAGGKCASGSYGEARSGGAEEAAARAARHAQVWKCGSLCAWTSRQRERVVWL